MLKRALPWLLKLPLTIGALYWVFHQINFADLTAALHSQQQGYLLVAVGCILIQAFFGALRWHILLLGLGQTSTSLFRTTHIYCASLLFNIWVPGTFGSDICRVIMLRKDKLRTSTILASVFFDRVFSLLGIIILAMLLLPLTLPLLGMNTNMGFILMGIGSMLTIAGIIIFFFTAPKLDRITRPKRLLPFISPFTCLARNPSATIAALLAAIAAHLFSCLCIYVLGISLSVSLSLLACLCLVPYVMLVASLPISFSGWGIREIGMTTALAFAGVDTASAVLISLQAGFIVTFVNLLGGMAYIGYKRK